MLRRTTLTRRTVLAAGALSAGAALLEGCAAPPRPPRTPAYRPTTKRVVHASRHGARGDRVDLTDAAVHAGGSIGSRTRAFASDDAGKLLIIFAAAVAGRAPTAHITTIARVSGGLAVLAAPCPFTGQNLRCSFGHDDSAALQAASNAAAGSDRRGGGVLLDAGVYLLSSAISTPDHVYYRGAGQSRTVLSPVGRVDAFYRLGKADAPVTGMAWIDLTVDGVLQTIPAKGWYLNHVTKSFWVRTSCLNTGASGFGSDYLDECYYIDCTARNCGRLGTVTSLGCSGFGIGTGAWKREAVHLINCTAVDNRRFGVFFENQHTGIRSAGPTVTGGLYARNWQGISDQGSDGLVVTGARVTDNVANGVFVGTSSPAIHQAGRGGRIEHCTIERNGGNGIRLDWASGVFHDFGPYTVRSNRLVDNAGSQIAVRSPAGRTVSNVIITGNSVLAGGVGVSITGGAFSTLQFARNTMRRDAQRSTDGRAACGLAIDATLTGGSITHNRFVGSATASGGAQVRSANGMVLTADARLRGVRVADNGFSGFSGRSIGRV